MTSTAALSRVPRCASPQTSRVVRINLAHRSHRRSSKTVPRANSDVPPGGNPQNARMGGGTDDNGRMHVPTDAFGGMSPEHKAASALKNLFTMVAVRVVLKQELDVVAEKGDGAVMTDTHRELSEYLRNNPLRDGNVWLEQLMRHPEHNMRRTALRVLAIRKTYTATQFDFDSMRVLAVSELKKENDLLMAGYVNDSLALADPNMGQDGMGH